MQIIADLHIHGKFSRGCSTKLDIQNLEKYAKIKGLNLLGTGDFTHPGWVKEIKENLTEEDGVLKTKTGFPFLCQTEISLIYSTNGKGRRVHNVVLAPSLEVVDQITEALLKRGRIDYDGRPIFKIPCPEFTEMLRDISKDIEVIPAHIWTPHFSVLGEYNQFNNMEECFEDQTKHIHALETGLSSDPPMNWRLSCLDKFNLVSFSDSHSFWPWRIGREATIFDCDLTYKSVLNSIRTGEGLKETVEVSPFFGKYHFSGHRNCNVCLDPVQSKEHNQICPKCGKKLIIGVAERVEVLADREEGFKPENAKEFKTLMPLAEILSKVMAKGIATKTVQTEYERLIAKHKSEFNILLNVKKEELDLPEHLKDIIMKNRKGKIEVEAGYDGLYGIPILKPEDKTKKEIITTKKQFSLKEF